MRKPKMVDNRLLRMRQYALVFRNSEHQPNKNRNDSRSSIVVCSNGWPENQVRMMYLTVPCNAINSGQGKKGRKTLAKRWLARGREGSSHLMA